MFVREFRDNWLILVIAFLCLMFAFTAPALALPFLFGSIIDEFGWTREQVTLLASAKFATGAIFSVVVGRFIDVVGVRRALIAVSVIGALALMSFLWTPNLAVYYLSGALLGIAAPGTIVAIKVLISRTFHASQGTAMGVAMLGTALGGVIVPIVITALIAAYGWRIATAALSLGIWLVALPLLVFGVTDRMLEASSAGVLTESRQTAGIEWGPLRELMRAREFWLIGVAVMMAGFVDQAFLQHQVLYLRVDLGMSAAFVAAGVSAMGAIGIAARILVGGIFDRFSGTGVSLLYVVLTASCLLAFGALNPYLFAAFVVFRALGHAAVLLDTTVLTKHTFGLANIGVLLGVYTAMVNIGFALGPWVVARMHDATGTYTSGFLLCAAVGLFAALVLLPVRPVFWIAMRERLRHGEAAVAAK